VVEEEEETDTLNDVVEEDNGDDDRGRQLHVQLLVPVGKRRTGSDTVEGVCVVVPATTSTCAHLVLPTTTLFAQMATKDVP